MQGFQVKRKRRMGHARLARRAGCGKRNWALPKEDIGKNFCRRIQQKMP